MDYIREKIGAKIDVSAESSPNKTVNSQRNESKSEDLCKSTICIINNGSKFVII